MPKIKTHIDTPSSEQLKKYVVPYSDEELSKENLEDKIDKLMKFFDLHGIAYDKFNPERLSYIEKKKAYPNYDQYIYVPGQHDTGKWLEAVKKIYYKQKEGLPYKEAIRSATQNWKKMEIYDFLNWLRFYEEGSHMKYKFAQVWYENGQPGYFLHIKQDEKPDVPVVDDNVVNDAREEVSHNEERKQTIEKQRQKIIGRLDSAEKLLRSQEGQEFAGAELENLMEAIYNLKKKVQLVNKISISTRLYEDMIVREANILGRRGFMKAADILYSMAQIPSATPPDDPSGAGNPGAPGGLPMQAPGSPNINTTVNNDQNKDQPPPSSLKGSTNNNTITSTPTIIPKEINPQPKGLSQFIDNMNDGNKTIEEDNLEVEDSEEDLLVSEAQISTNIPATLKEEVPMTTNPAPAPLNPAKPFSLESPKPKDSKITENKDAENPATEIPLEVSEDDITPKNEMKPESSATGFDLKIDSLFSNLSVSDVVAKLEDLAKIFKVREVPRQLAIVDMMLDSLGLASYFPSLSEAQNKALDSNNYISTRVEDILSKLRGAMTTKEIDLKGGTEKTNSEVAGIKGKLDQDTEKEKQRKQMRKEQENAEFDNSKKETPNVEIAEDLGAPPIPAAIKQPIPKPLG